MLFFISTKVHVLIDYFNRVKTTNHLRRMIHLPLSPPFRRLKIQGTQPLFPAPTAIGQREVPGPGKSKSVFVG